MQDSVQMFLKTMQDLCGHRRDQSRQNLLSHHFTEAAWKTKPSWAIVATEDKSIDPGLERTMYKRAGSKVTELTGSHVVFMSKPKEVAAVIEAAANGKQ